MGKVINKRKSIPIEWKQQLGDICCNCGSKENIQYHHIIPISFGGNDILSNMCCLCENCHNLIHNMKRNNWKECHKKGIEKAKLAGIHFGKKPIENEPLMQSISENFTIFKGGALTINEICELNKIKLTTFYKYKKQLLEDLEKEEWNHNFAKPIRILKTPLYEHQILEARKNGITIQELQQKRLNK